MIWLDTGVQLVSGMSWLLQEMVEATWTDLPSDYVPPVA